jgi:hypothetical protein
MTAFNICFCYTFYMFENPNLTTSETAVESITIDGEGLEIGQTKEIFCNGERFVGTIAAVEQSVDGHTVNVILEDMTEPEVAERQRATFSYDTNSRTWKLG